MHTENGRVRLPAAQRRRCRPRRVALHLWPAIALMMGAVTVGSAQRNTPRPPGKPPAPARLIVRLTGLHDRRGQVIVSLFNRPEGFPAHGALVTQKVDLSKGAGLKPLIVTFRNLKPGVYAVSAYHDANNNNRLDSNFLHIPQEDWGMSNNPRPWRTPRFDEAHFDLKAPETSITIPLTH